MERLVFACALLVILEVFFCVDAQPNDDKLLENYQKKKSTSLWFGPRLGRKKRNQVTDDIFYSAGIECEQLDDYIKIIPWTLIAKCRINEDKRDDKTKSKQFIPRLGRESGEELASTNMGEKWLQNPDFIGELMSQRSPPFAPRLGRRTTPFAPRLGRENNVLNY